MRNYIFAIIAGIIAGLVKPTTYAVFLFAALLTYFEYGYRTHTFQSVNASILLILKGGLLTLISVAFVYLWTEYSNSIKELNPYQPWITNSAEMITWNFGTKIKSGIVDSSGFLLSRNDSSFF